MKPYEQGPLPGDWDEGQQTLGAHMLQGSPWAAFQSALRREVIWQRGDGWSWLGIVTHGRGVKYLYAPYGPTARSALTFEHAMDSLMRSATELGLDFVRCEPVGVPEAAVVKLGLVRVADDQPKHSLVVNLDRSEEELKADLSSSHRNTINGAERRGITMRKSTEPSDIDAFLRLTHLTAKDRGITPHSNRYYRTMLETLIPRGAASLFIAEHEGKAVSVSIALDYLSTRGYAHTGNDPAARKLRATAPLVWMMMLDAKAGGMKRFDLWGIAPADAPEDHPWRGFTDFKRAFGGEEVNYTGRWELPIKPFKYKLIRMAKKVRGGR